jgi:hypothetical protein
MNQRAGNGEYIHSRIQNSQNDIQYRHMWQQDQPVVQFGIDSVPENDGTSAGERLHGLQGARGLNCCRVRSACRGFPELRALWTPMVFFPDRELLSLRPHRDPALNSQLDNPAVRPYLAALP